MAKNSWVNVVIKGALITGACALYIFVESGTRDQLSRIEDKIDRVETKVDEVSGYFKYTNENPTKDNPPPNMTK